MNILYLLTNCVFYVILFSRRCFSFIKEADNSFNFSGKRLKRVLYVDKNYGKRHADINGSYNILRKSGLETEEIVRIDRENKKQGLGIKVN